jgi:hypothetical protein
MSDKSENKAKAKAKNKKGKREPTSLHVDPELWQEVRVMAVLKNKSVTQYFEESLRQKLDEDSKNVKFPVGHGGVYIPPPPQQQTQTQIDNKEAKFEETVKVLVDKYKVDEKPRLIETLEGIAKKYKFDKLEVANYLKMSKVMNEAEHQRLKQELKAWR